MCSPARRHVYGKEYGWIVLVFNGLDSFGESYYYFQ